MSGKLDPNGNVYTAERIKEAIANQDYEGTDPFGVPILTLDSVLEAQVELGAGPLHSQFDDEGYVYTSLFIDTAVAKWSLGPKAGHEGDDAFKLVETLPVQYNIGHLVTAEGDTVKPAGKYLVALNKWSIDRFAPVGTLHPQNFQLVDLAGEQMTVLLDMPIGMGEPHYVQMIHRDKLTNVIQAYEPGTDPLTWSTSEFAIVAGEERVERQGHRRARLHERPALALHPRRDRGQAGRHLRLHLDERRADAGRDARVRDPRLQHRGLDRPRRGREHRPAADAGSAPSRCTARSSARRCTWRCRAGSRWRRERRGTDDTAPAPDETAIEYRRQR